MPNIVLDEVASGYKVSTINENFGKIEQALNSKVLYRETDEPNSMGQSLDANNFPVINVRTPKYNKEAANKLYVDAAIEQALSGVEGETVDFQLLIERVGDAEAAITTEQLVRASEDEALASSLTQLNASVGQVSADIIQEATARATAEDAVASMLSSVSAITDMNSAAITAEVTARTNQYSALASDITTIQANVGSNTAAIANEQTARVNADNALAYSISSVSSNVDGLSSSVTSQLSTVNTRLGGMESKYTLTIDNNGYVSGFESVANADSSSFTVKADTFKIAMPGYGNYVPFAVGPSDVLFNGVTNWSGVSGSGKPQDNATVGATFGVNIAGKITPGNVTTFIDNATINTAQIADAAIKTAKIGEAQIDTLRVGIDQITVPRHYYVSGPAGVDLVVGGTCVSGYIDPKGSKVTLIASVTAIAGSGYFRNMTVTIFDPLGQIVSTCGVYTSTADKYYYTATAIGSSTLTGTYTVYAGVGGATGPISAHDASLIMLATKR